MSIDMNSVSLIGRLGQDPEGRYTPSGKAVTTFDIAVNDDYTKDGQKIERVYWIRIETWGRMAEVANEYLRKKSQVAIIGKLVIDKVPQEGGGNRYYTKVVANSMQMLKDTARDGQRQYADEEEPVLF